MNAKKILAMLVLTFALVLVLASCEVTVKDKHEFTDWTIQTPPTEEDSGIALGECVCGEIEKVTIPALTDTEVWTKEVTPATHTSKGIIAYTSIYGSVEFEQDVIPHEWTYTVTLAPTETASGEAVKACECGASEDLLVPVLTYGPVWSGEVTKAPSHTEEGEKVYTSELFGSVTVVLPMEEHQHGAWNMTEAPSATATGTAVRECACGDVETVTVPVITDTTVWTANVTTPASYNAAGLMTYTSEYGSVEAVIPKLVAPYDGKTYTNLVFDGELEDSNKVIVAQDTWSNATLTLDENGFGFCVSYPYRGFTQITMVDPATGRINITIYDMISVDADGNALETPIPNYDSYVVYPAYVDFATGMIIRARNNAFDYVVLYTPYEADPSADSAVASSWNGNAMAITYTVNGNAYNVFCSMDKAYFNVSFSGMADAISADACYNAPYVYIRNAAGELIASFGYDGEKQNVLDGYEGTYTNSDNGDLVVSGFGTLTLGGMSGTYTVAAEGADYDLDVYLKDAEGNVTHFYLVVLGDDHTYTLSMPKVTVQFVTGEYATEEDAVYNKFVPQILPTYEHATMTFKGWYYDAACTQPVASPFIPAEDVTLYAKWKEKVVITLVGTIGDDANVIYLGEGDVIGDFLPSYNLDLDNYKKFVAWYVDMNGNGEVDAEDVALDLETTIGANDSGATVIAKWEDLPPYYGTYYVVEIWNASYGNTSPKTPLVIDENGNMSGLKTGIIISYDPETQAVQWKDNAQATKIKTFYFDVESGVIAGIYNNDNINNDFYFCSRYTGATNGIVDAHYGVKAPKTPGSTSFGYYAHFITADTKLGADSTIFLYNNHIYNDVTVTTATGEPLTPATVKDAKTVIVKDNDTGDIIVAVSSIGSSFDANNTTKVLDAYFGVYTMGDETVALDGTGIITYNGKTGKYTVTETGFDVYFTEDGKNTEYYVMTLDTEAKTCTLVKPMANVTLDINGVDADFAQIGEANINITIELPTPTHENYVFRGWYVAGDDSMTPVGETYVPTTDVTLVAIWKVKYTLTVVYNDNATENSVFVYGEGEVADINDPAYAKHKFDGWFTTAIFAEGSEWTSGVAMTENVTIYAKWSDAPIYNLTYVPTELTKSTSAETGVIKVYTRTAAILNIDPNGKAPTTGYPFSGGSTVTDYDPVAGTLVLKCGIKSYRGFIDKATGMILLNHESGDGDMKEFFLLNPFSTNSILSYVTASYWNDGMTACIVYEYSDEVTYTIFVNNNQVYFGVSFEDAEGNPVAGNACYQTPLLNVRDAEGNLIAYFAYNGTTMCELDGNEGTYTNPEMGDLVISGHGPLTMNGVNGTYTQSDNGTLDVLLQNADNVVTMYYIVTLDKENRTYTAATVPVTLTFVSEYGSAEAQNGHAYVPSALPTLAQEGFVFRGWYVQGDEDQTIVDASAFVTGESVTLVAKWDPMISVTIVYGNTMESVTHYYGAGDTPVLVEPSYLNGKAFEGWYTDADCTVAYVSGPISENTTIYVNWMDAHPMFGSYTGSNVYGGTAHGNTNSGGTRTVTFTVDAQGNVTFAYSNKTETGEIKEYDPATGMFKFYTTETSFRLGIFDAASGVMVLNYDAGVTTMSNDVYVFAPGSTFNCGSSYGCYWNSGKTKLGAIQCDAGVINYFMFDGRVYGNVTWTSTDGEVEAKLTYKASNLAVYDSEGNMIAYFAYKDSSTGLVQKFDDGFGGTYYTDGENNAMILNGFGAGSITNEANALSGAIFTYTVMADDAEYDLLVVIGDAYYKVTLADNTYSIEHIVYTLTFVTGIEGVTVENVTVEHNADYRLPSDITAVGYKFEGWYTTPEYTERVYWSEENTNATYYAKWSVTCTVTLVYGGDIPNSNLSYNSGVTLSMGATLSADGASLYVWYSDEAHTQLFTSTTVTGNMTLYGVKVADVTYGDYEFVNEDGSLVSDNAGIGSSTASVTVTMLGNYSLTYNYVVSSESGWDKFSVSQTVGGVTSTPITGASGDDEGTKTVAMAAGDSITFKYTKDSSGNSGDDCVTLTFTITPIA